MEQERKQPHCGGELLLNTVITAGAAQIVAILHRTRTEADNAQGSPRLWLWLRLWHWLGLECWGRDEGGGRGT